MLAFFKDQNFKTEVIEKTKGDKAKKVENKIKVPKDYIDQLTLKRYSPNTLRTYVQLFEDFINYYAHRDIKELAEDEIKSYLLYLVEQRKVSSSYQNQAINAIKFYYEKVLGGVRQYYFIERPFKEKKLPEVLSEEEITFIRQA